MKYVCEMCGTVYDEETGDMKRGIPAGTAFADLPPYYDCPICGSEKEAFTKIMPVSRAASTKGNDNASWKSMKYAEEHHESNR